MATYTPPVTSPTKGKTKVLPRISSWVCLIALLLLANSLLINQVPSRQTPDEIIPVQVIKHMRTSGSLDTDWAHVQTFPDYFKRVHFNFSGYIMAAAAFAAITRTPANDGSLLSCLRLFSRLCMLALLLLVFIVARRLWGDGYALLATCATLTAPLLFQDAHYARPEAFGTLLFTCALALAACGNGSNRRDFLRLVLIAALSGFLVSIKITYAAAAVFGAPVLWRCTHRRGSNNVCWQRVTLLVLLTVVLFAAGFAAGAPYALRSPQVFLDGLIALSNQYGGGHPPHSRPDYQFLNQFGWIGGYFTATLGWLVMPLHALGYLNRDVNTQQRQALLAYLTIATITVLFFAHEHVFFERNFSHLLPGFLIIAAGGVKWLSTILLADVLATETLSVRRATIAIVFALWQFTPVRVSSHLHRTFSKRGVSADARKHEQMVQATSREIGAVQIKSVDFFYVFRDLLPPVPTGVCVLYDVATYGDPWSQRFIAGLKPPYHIASKTPSLFSDVPTSTLQTYQSATHYLVYDAKLCHTGHS